MEFKKKGRKGKACIHCKTEEEAKELLRYAQEMGYKWCGGGSLDMYNNWDWYKEETCYYFENKKMKVEYSDLDYFKEDYKILDYTKDKNKIFKQERDNEVKKEDVEKDNCSKL